MIILLAFLFRPYHGITLHIYIAHFNNYVINNRECLTHIHNVIISVVKTAA